MLVSEFGSGNIDRINLTTLAVTTLLSPGGNPEGLAYDGTRLFANLGFRYGGPTGKYVAEIDPVTGAILATSPGLNDLDGLTYDPYSGLLYASSYFGNTVYSIDPNNLANVQDVLGSGGGIPRPRRHHHGRRRKSLYCVEHLWWRFPHLSVQLAHPCPDAGNLCHRTGRSGAGIRTRLDSRAFRPRAPWRRRCRAAHIRLAEATVNGMNPQSPRAGRPFIGRHATCKKKPAQTRVFGSASPMTASMPHLDQVTPARILVVDSKQSDYDDLLGIAVADGCEIRFLTTGRAALRQWRETRGGLLIINVELPDLSGFDLVEMLQPFRTGTIVFLVDNQYAVEDEVRALRLGVSGYLCKPLAGSVLYQCRSNKYRRPGTPSLTCTVGMASKAEGGQHPMKPGYQATRRGNVFDSVV